MNRPVLLSLFPLTRRERFSHALTRVFRSTKHTHTYTLTTPQANTFSPVARRHSCVYVCTHIARAHVFPQRHRIYTRTHTISTCSVCINIWWCIANTSIDCSSIDKANTHSTISSVSVQCSATTYIIDTGQEQPVVPNNKHTYTEHSLYKYTIYITYIQHIYIYTFALRRRLILLCKASRKSKSALNKKLQRILHYTFALHKAKYLPGNKQTSLLKSNSVAENHQSPISIIYKYLKSKFLFAEKNKSPNFKCPSIIALQSAGR